MTTKLKIVVNAAVVSSNFCPIVGNSIAAKTKHKMEDIIYIHIAVLALFSHLNSGKKPPLGVYTSGPSRVIQNAYG